SHSYIATVPGRGYRFVAEVNERTKDAVFRPQPEHAIAEPPIEKPGAKAAEAKTIEAPQTVSWMLVKPGWLWMAVAIAILGLAMLFPNRHPSLPAGARNPGSSRPADTVVSAPARIPEKSIAVLPFDNLSDDKQNAFFAAGVQDEIISDLAMI